MSINSPSSSAIDAILPVIRDDRELFRAVRGLPMQLPLMDNDQRSIVERGIAAAAAAIADGTSAVRALVTNVLAVARLEA